MNYPCHHVIASAPKQANTPDNGRKYTGCYLKCERHTCCARRFDLCSVCMRESFLRCQPASRILVNRQRCNARILIQRKISLRACLSSFQKKKKKNEQEFKSMSKGLSFCICPRTKAMKKNYALFLAWQFLLSCVFGQRKTRKKLAKNDMVLWFVCGKIIAKQGTEFFLFSTMNRESCIFLHHEGSLLVNLEKHSSFLRSS